MKSLTQVQDPDQSDWNGKQCAAVLAHEGRQPRAGHWVAFLRQNGIWWRVDSNHRGPILENPFDTQLDPSQATRANDFTIDILFFA